MSPFEDDKKSEEEIFQKDERLVGLYFERVPLRVNPLDLQPEEQDIRAMYIAMLMRIAHLPRQEDGGILALPPSAEEKRFGSFWWISEQRFNEKFWFPVTKFETEILRRKEEVRAKELLALIGKLQQNLAKLKMGGSLQLAGAGKVFVDEVAETIKHIISEATGTEKANYDQGLNKEKVGEALEYFNAIRQYAFGHKTTEEMFEELQGHFVFPPTLESIEDAIRENIDREKIYGFIDWDKFYEQMEEARNCTDPNEADRNYEYWKNLSETKSNRFQKVSACDVRTRQQIAELWRVRGLQLRR